MEQVVAQMYIWEDVNTDCYCPGHLASSRFQVITVATLVGFFSHTCLACLPKFETESFTPIITIFERWLLVQFPYKFLMHDIINLSNHWFRFGIVTTVSKYSYLHVYILMQTPFQSTTVSSFFVSNGSGDIKWRPIIRNAFILFNIISTLVPLLRRYSRNILPDYFYYTENDNTNHETLSWPEMSGWICRFAHTKNT